MLKRLYFWFFFLAFSRNDYFSGRIDKFFAYFSLLHFISCYFNVFYIVIIFLLQVFRHVYGLAIPFDCTDTNKLAFFELSLLVLPVVKVLYEMDPAVTKNDVENTATYVKVVDKVSLCVVILKNSIEISNKKNESLMRSF